MADNVWIDTGPRLLAALMCEDVAVSIVLNNPAVDGRLTLQRVYTQVSAPVYPATWTRLVLYSLWTGGEVDRLYKVEGRLRTPKGDVLATSQHTYKGRVESETFACVMYLGVASGVPLILPEPGRYTIELVVDDAVVSDVALYALKFEPPAPPTTPAGPAPAAQSTSQPEPETEVKAMPQPAPVGEPSHE